ncbi:MAG TPA: carboxy terminal-processing peptidase [Pirellulales bacterium]|jgi:carboxyl-terminal processing protease|nr:carboxy terminal-processing peptidase [Pirellulales bacterium]
MNRATYRWNNYRRLLWTGLAAGLIVWAGAVIVRAATGPAPQALDRQISRTVTRLLIDENFTKQPLNEDMSHRAFNTFLKTLDPMKVYFTQADVDEFSKYKDTMADMIKKGDVTLAYSMFNRFLQRVDQRLLLVDELLSQPMDFSVDEDLKTDPKQLDYAKNDAEIRDRWRKRLKYDLLAKKADKVADQEAHDKVERRYHSFAKRMHQTTSDELLERFLTALTTSFDPHTDYMSAKTLENFDINMSLKLEGIGAALEYELEEGCTKVSRLIPGGPAEKDNRLKPEDRVLAVGQGVDGALVDVADMSLNDVVDLIRGKAGTMVRLQVQAATGGDPHIIDITRASIELKDEEARAEIFHTEPAKADQPKMTTEEMVKSTIIESDAHKPNGQPYKIGVIDLPSFYMDMKGAKLGLSDYRSTTRDTQKILEDFNSKGVDAVVLDLRRNGGGSLVEAVSLTGLFIDEGPVVQVKDSNGRVQHYDDNDKGVAWAGPLVVLQSKFSASASEIFAGAIQDYGRGIIVGDKTSHGKGTVQSLLDVSGPFFGNMPNAPQLGALKVTIQQFYRPDGDSTQNRGVVSDIELPSLTTHFDVGESDLDYALKFDHIDPAEYTKVNMVDKILVDELKNRSAKRTADSEDFQKLDKKIGHYVEQKDRKTVPLNQDKFLTERAELNTEQEEEKQFEQLDDPNRPVVKRDFYFNEVLNITLDYLQLGKKLAAADRVTTSGHRTISLGQ